MKYDGGLYFKTLEEMSQRFERSDVIANTLAIADSVNVISEKRDYVPRFRFLRKPSMSRHRRSAAP